jgi:glycosyltransferase involved in cell wall biosynthesis
MFDALNSTDVDLVQLGHSVRTRRPSIVRRGLSRLTNRLRPRRASHASALLERSRTAATRIEQELAGARVDVICAPAASQLVAFLETKLPVVYMSDTTWAQVRSYYPEHENLPRATADEKDALERRAILRADLLVYPSTWAAGSAERDYGADPKRIHIVPYGANIDVAPPATSLPHRDASRECRLLFIGNQWHRKGGDLALETLSALTKLGTNATLAIVSGNIPKDAKLPQGAVPIGHIDKNVPRDRARLEELLFGSHFLLLPTRADCSPIVCCEAAAYGLPVVATATGGIPNLIEDGVSGYIVPEGSRGDDYARVIRGALDHPTRVAELARNARRRYEERLNWAAWGRDVADVLRQARH